MIAPRLGNASISLASMSAWPASTIALTDAPCSARKSSRPASTGSTRASYFAVRAAASGGGTSPTCRTVAASTPSSRRPLLPSLVVPQLGYAKYVAANTAPVRERYPTLDRDHRCTSEQRPWSQEQGRRRRRGSYQHHS